MTPRPVIARVREIGEQATAIRELRCWLAGPGVVGTAYGEGLVVVGRDAVLEIAEKQDRLSSPALDVIEALQRVIEYVEQPIVVDDEDGDQHRGVVVVSAASPVIRDARAALDAWTQAATQEIGEGR